MVFFSLQEDCFVAGRRRGAGLGRGLMKNELYFLKNAISDPYYGH